MNQLQFFTTPKDDLKINLVFQDSTALAEIGAASPDKGLPDAAAYYTDLRFPPAPADRPYTLSSIVLSSDGKMAYQDNPAGPLVAKNNFMDPAGSLGDFWVLNVLRAYADGIIIGANTLAKEPGITCHVYDESLSRQRKETLGKPCQPVGVVVSFDATDIPFDHYTFACDPAEAYKLVINTSPQGLDYINANSPLKHVVWGPFASREEVDAFQFPSLYQDFDVFPVIVTGQGNRPDAELLMYVLRKLGMERLCVESPSYCAHMLDKGLLDEYFINYSMVFVGGPTTPGAGTPFGSLEHPHAKLLSLGVHHSNFMFTRQKLCYGVSSQTDLSAFNY